jgi:hypothetical protein
LLFDISSTSISLADSQGNSSYLDTSLPMLQHKMSSKSSDEAAATLQAATRGMLARKSFRRVRMQTMASLVIQKSLFQWWVHKGASTSTSKNFRNNPNDT